MLRAHTPFLAEEQDKGDALSYIKMQFREKSTDAPQNYVLQDNLLLREIFKGLLFVLLYKHQSDIARKNHTLTGHMGVQSTLNIVQGKYCWKKNQ